MQGKVMLILDVKLEPGCVQNSYNFQKSRCIYVKFVFPNLEFISPFCKGSKFLIGWQVSVILGLNTMFGAIWFGVLPKMLMIDDFIMGDLLRIPNTHLIIISLIFKVKSHEIFMNLLSKVKGMFDSILNIIDKTYVFNQGINITAL